MYFLMLVSLSQPVTFAILTMLSCTFQWWSLPTVCNKNDNQAWITRGEKPSCMANIPADSDITRSLVQVNSPGLAVGEFRSPLELNEPILSYWKQYKFGWLPSQVQATAALQRAGLTCQMSYFSNSRDSMIFFLPGDAFENWAFSAKSQKIHNIYFSQLDNL